MSEATVSPILAVAAIAVVFAALGLNIAVDLPWSDRLRRFAVAHAQEGALAVAAVAMAGSLYYSEVADFVPCEFCWYQRIAMYPTAVILAVAVVTRQQLPARYPVVVAVIGLALSIYHYQLQLNPEQRTVCTGGVPCTARYVYEFHLVSIPFMAGAGFTAILLIYLSRWRARRVLATSDQDGMRPPG